MNSISGPDDWPLILVSIALWPASMGVLAWAMHRRSLQVSDAGLRLRRWPWPRIVPWAEVDLAGARPSWTRFASADPDAAAVAPAPAPR